MKNSNSLEGKSLRLPDPHVRVFGRVHVVLMLKGHVNNSKAPYFYFKVENRISLLNFHRLNLLCLDDFFKCVDDVVMHNPHRSTAFCAGETVEEQAHSAILLGAYMLMRMEFQLEEILLRLETAFGSNPLSANRSGMVVKDFLGALNKAKDLAWVDFSDEGFDPEEYAYFSSPLNAGIFEMIRSRLLVSASPRIISAEHGWEDVYEDGQFKRRDFSPTWHAEQLRQFDVTTCIRLGALVYPADSMQAFDICIHDLFCEDLEVPTVELVERFVAMVDGAGGSVAVQGGADLGLAVTLIGAFAMRKHGLSAAEAAAWVHLVRPCSLSAPQLRFLCDLECAATPAPPRCRSANLPTALHDCGGSAAILPNGPAPGGSSRNLWQGIQRCFSSSFSAILAPPRGAVAPDTSDRARVPKASMDGGASGAGELPGDGAALAWGLEAVSRRRCSA